MLIKPVCATDEMSFGFVSTPKRNERKAVVMATLKKTHYRGGATAFTMIEIMVVLVILAIAALIAVPMMSSAADMQVRGAANRLAADLDYAKNMAITHQKPYTVVFDAAAESYQIQDADGVIDNPLRPGSLFQVSFPNERSMSRVAIDSITLDPVDASDAITFDYLGTPYSGTEAVSGSAFNNAGQITLTADSFSLMVVVEPMTGYVTIMP